MASPPTYVVRTTVVEAHPRLREEVREELREEIRLLDMNRISPEDKLRTERAAVETSVGEVELFEKSWRKSAAETLAELERRIDALGTEPRLAEPAPPAPLPLRRAPVPDVTPAPPALAPAPARALGKRLSPAEQRAVAKHLRADVVRASVLFTTTRGRVVEVTYERAGAKHTLLVILTVGGEVATIDEVGAKLDAMPLPSPSAPPTLEASEALDIAPARPELAPRDELVEAIEGIGEAYGKKLNQAGLRTVQDLVAADAEDLAEETGISVNELRKWKAMGRLQAIRGVGPQYSEILVRAGVTSPEELAGYEPDELARKVNAYQATLEVRVQGNPVTPALTTRWIEGARELPGVEPAAAEETEEAPKKKRGLGFGAKKPAPKAKAERAPAEGKRKFGLKFGRKK